MKTTDEFYQKLSEAEKGYKPPRVITSGQGAYLTIDGQPRLNFCSSHYLGFAVDARLRQAATEAMAKYGIGTGYRTLAGTHELHLELERSIAKFKGTQGAMVLSSAYAANAAAIQTILGKEDIVISDALNHASIIDAVRLSGVKQKLVYAHADMADLEAKLQEAAELRATPKADGSALLVLIVTDGVFSMDGDLAPLPRIVELAKQYDAITMVDDAHGEGVMGKGGRGVVDHFGLVGQVDIEVGSLSKAFSVMGGFIAGRHELINFYNAKARQRLFSIALTIPDTAAALEAVRILDESQDLVQKLWDNVDYLRKGFTELGFDIGHSETPIIPVMLGDEDTAREVSAKLFDDGVFATPIVFPMVPKGTARIRVIVSASFSREDCDKGLAAFKRATGR
ncbi:MAG TPA: aminotransferase class I/II-fold pyridoxal phosphate-dependent enzyme [Candidatus Saccharimonadia bacterium]|nr:aminotransferase class I/II-fold pyridoxal phosphate-dependent enzyme [Candidatus Saccharimonadia bacterium]